MPDPDTAPTSPAVPLDTKAFGGGQFYVWRKHGRAPRVMHSTSGAAIAEAERLSALHGGATIMVMQAIARVKGAGR